MKKLSLRNSTTDSGAWFFTSTMFCLVSLACFVGLVAMQFRDPDGRWLGPNVKAPFAVYLFLEGLAFVFFVVTAILTWTKGRKFFDGSVQVVMDDVGIHDLRKNGEEIAWEEIADLKCEVLYQNGIAVAAQLRIRVDDGSSIAFDILGLEVEPEAIGSAAQKAWKKYVRKNL